MARIKPCNLKKFLIYLNLFIKHNLQINIKIPDGGSEDNWNFNGQIIQLEVDPRTKIGRIKDLLSGLLGGLTKLIIFYI